MSGMGAMSSTATYNQTYGYWVLLFPVSFGISARIELIKPDPRHSALLPVGVAGINVNCRIILQANRAINFKFEERKHSEREEGL